MFRNLTPVVRALLYTNFIVYGLQWLTSDQLLDTFALWPWGEVGCPECHPFEPWQLVTYAFLHGGIWHLAGNMFAHRPQRECVEQLVVCQPLQAVNDEVGV